MGRLLSGFLHVRAPNERTLAVLASGVESVFSAAPLSWCSFEARCCEAVPIMQRRSRVIQSENSIHYVYILSSINNSKRLCLGCMSGDRTHEDYWSRRSLECCQVLDTHRLLLQLPAHCTVVLHVPNGLNALHLAPAATSSVSLGPGPTVELSSSPPLR